ncbi:MerR family transcriptional regulator [Microvirga mediterraneensis]|uniref:MerR family transcriptional regulator n=1 Tax=Microvirga mediterraneensis TaxID=2754695 RepID=A0A838BUG1_9HYPH|nr:MerR family transcriptional regulator [Microvirga mediterraneensis]MBA1158988.1 MerR family transcriptional regulator [Microvirga mediterraneensis]
MLTLDEFQLRLDVDARTVQVWVDEGWLLPQRGQGGLAFSELDVARARLIRDLKDGIGVNHEGIGIVLNLIDQVHGLRSILRELLLAGTARPPGA